MLILLLVDVKDRLVLKPKEKYLLFVIFHRVVSLVRRL